MPITQAALNEIIADMTVGTALVDPVVIATDYALSEHYGRVLLAEMAIEDGLNLSTKGH